MLIKELETTLMVSINSIRCGLRPEISETNALELARLYWKEKTWWTTVTSLELLQLCLSSQYQLHGITVACNAMILFTECLLDGWIPYKESIYCIAEIRFFVSSLSDKMTLDRAPEPYLENLLELSEKCILPLFLSGDQQLEGVSLAITSEINAQKCALLSLVVSITVSYERIKLICSNGSSGSSNSRSKDACIRNISQCDGNEVVDLMFLACWRRDFFFAVCDVMVEVYPHIHEGHLQDLEERLFKEVLVCSKGAANSRLEKVIRTVMQLFEKSGSERWIQFFRKVFALLSLEDVYNVRDGVNKLLKVYPQFSSALVFSLEKAAVSLLKDKTVGIDEPSRPTRSDLQILLILYRLELNQQGTNKRSGWQWDRFVGLFSHNSDNRPIEDSETVDRKENSDMIVKVFYRVCECLVNLTSSDKEDSASKSASSSTTNKLQAIISIIVPSSDGADHFRSDVLRSIEDLVLDSVLERKIQSKLADTILLAVFSLYPPDVESNLFVRALNLLSDGSSKGLYGRSELLELFVHAVCEYFPARIPSLLPGFQHLLSKPALEIVFPAIFKAVLHQGVYAKELLSIAPKSKLCQRIVIDGIFRSLLVPVHLPTNPATPTATIATASSDNIAATWSATEVLEYLTDQNPSLEYHFYYQLFIACSPNLLSDQHPSGVNSNLSRIIPYFIREIDGKINLYLQSNGVRLELRRSNPNDRSGQDILLLLRLQWRLSAIENSEKVITEIKLFLSDLLTNGAYGAVTVDESHQHREDACPFIRCLYAIIDFCASGFQQDSDSMADLTCSYIFSYAALSAIVLIVVEVRNHMTDEFPELAEALQLLHSMADLFFDSVCKLSDNASLLDERNPLYHSGAISSHAELRQLYMIDVHSDQGNMFADDFFHTFLIDQLELSETMLKTAVQLIRLKVSSFQCGILMQNLCFVSDSIKYVCMGEATAAVKEGVSSLLEALLQCYIHTCSYDLEEKVWMNEAGALQKALEVLSSIQPLKISLRLKRKSKPAMKAETATAMATRKKSRGRIYVCDSSEDEEVDGEDIKKGIDMEIEEPECMYDTSDFEVTLQNGQEDHDCVDGHPSGVFDGFRIPVIKKEGTLSVHPLLCEIADSFPSAALNRNRWDVHHRLLSEEILSSCFSVVNDNLTYDPTSIIGMDREDSSKYDLTYRSKRVRMSTVKSVVRSIVRYKLFEMRTAALDSIATAIQAIHTMDHPPFDNRIHEKLDTCRYFVDEFVRAIESGVSPANFNAFVKVIKELQHGLLSTDDHDQWILNSNPILPEKSNYSVRYEEFQVMSRKLLSCLKYFHSGDRNTVGSVIQLVMNFSGRLGQLSHCRQLIAHIGYGRFSKGEITMDNNKCNICADKVVVPLSMHHGGDAVCLYVLPNSKVGSALLSEAVKVFSEMVSSFSEMPFRSTTTTTTTDAYPIAYPTIVRTRAVILLHTMLIFFLRETVCNGDSEDDSGDDSVRHHVGARAREKSYYQLVFADQRIAQVLALIGKYIWYCEKEISQLAAANISLRKLAAEEVRRRRSRARNELHYGFSSDDDVCINEDIIDNDADEKEEVGENVRLRLGRPYDLHNRRSGVAQAALERKDVVTQREDTNINEFRNLCPLIHGLLSEGNFNLWGDLVQYLVGEVRSAKVISSSNCSVSSTATNRVHKRSLSLRKKLKRLSIRLSNLLQQINHPNAKIRRNRETVPDEDNDWSQLLTAELSEGLGQVDRYARKFIRIIDQCESSLKENEIGDGDDNSSDSDSSTMYMAGATGSLRSNKLDDKESMGRALPRKKFPKRTNAKRLRSRNRVVDSWLDEEDGSDAFADLEDFLVD